MKQSLQLKLGQHLTMTPQLQQAIRLLQLSSLELQTEIQTALESNPLLELAEEGDGDLEGGTEPAVVETSGESPAMETMGGESENHAAESDSAAENEIESTELGAALDANLPEDLPVDTSWDDVYDAVGTGGSGGAEDDMPGFENREGASGTLNAHLVWQMDLTPFSDTDRMIAAALIDAIDEDGYLSSPIEEIHQGLPAEAGVELDEVEAVLHRIQNFDPPGVGARNLSECLLIQLRQLPPETPRLLETKRLVKDHLPQLGSRDYTQIMRRMRLGQSELQEAIHLIQTLNPRPGSQVVKASAEYVTPDVIVRKRNGTWRVELNYEAVPRLRINTHYAGMIRRADNSDDNTFIKGRLQEARWFLKSLQSRNETLLKVASCIVERQRGFLEHGEEAMKALVLHDVAEEVGMHESTISRVTTKKYMFTPRGVFELKYFFSSHVGTVSGEVASSTAIRALIKKLVAEESHRKPLSDSKIAELLEKQGYNVARRTVAKYREAMAIPPSNERKQLV